MKKRIIFTVLTLVSIYVIILIKVPNVIDVNRVYLGQTDIWSVDFEADGSYVYTDKDKRLTSTIEMRTVVILKYNGDLNDLETFNTVGIKYLSTGRGFSTNGTISEENLIFKESNSRPGIKYYENFDSFEFIVYWDDGQYHEEKLMLFFSN